jgi:hypothetical protein
MNVTFFHRLVILLLVILLFNVIVDINIGVLDYLTQFMNTLNVKMTYVRQCVDEGIKLAKIIYEKCSQFKKKSHNHLKSPGRFIKKFINCGLGDPKLTQSLESFPINV